MKRMSEVLAIELPTCPEDLLHAMVHETSLAEDSAIAHAINHVDALADTLETVLAVLSGKTEFSSSEIDIDSCYAVLNAYRGDK